MNKHKYLIIMTSVSLFIVIACRLVTQEQATTATVIATTITAVQTQNTPTATSTPRPVSYPIDACMSVEIPPSQDIPFRWEFKECVESITVLEDSSLRVIYRWEYTKIGGENLPEHACLVKYPDYQNRNMYMVDNLGNRYDHTYTPNKTNVDLLCGNAEYGVYWDYFLFPPVNTEANYLIFYDDDQNIQTDPFDILWKR